MNPQELAGLAQRYQSLPTEDLVKAVTVNRRDFQPEAIELVEKELISRQVPLDKAEEARQKIEQEEAEKIGRSLSVGIEGNKVQEDGKKKATGGMIPEGFYSWFLGGVLVGGAVFVPIGTKIFMEGISPAVAWIGGVSSAALFLFCIDKRGNFRWKTAMFAIAVAYFGANAYHQSTGRPVAVVGGALGFLIYAIFGGIGVAIGKLVRGKQPKKEPTALDKGL
jgi:hypothetical protein